MHTPLANEIRVYKSLRGRLLDAFPQTDDETLTDTLEGITDLHAMISQIIRSALVDQALVAGLKTRAEEVKTRLTRLEMRAKKKRSLALEAMLEVGLKKLMEPDFTTSTRPGPVSLVVTSESEIPQEFLVPQPPKPDRQSMLAALKRGRNVPGAYLANPKPTLSVRTK